MMKALLTIIFFALSTQFVLGQQKRDQYAKQNLEWLDSLKNVTKKRVQIELVKKKIYRDTLFEDYSHRFVLDNPRKPERRICKVKIFVLHESEYFEVNLQRTPALKKCMGFLRPKNIKDIEILDGSRAAALFGASCGVVVLHGNSLLARKLRPYFPKVVAE